MKPDRETEGKKKKRKRKMLPKELEHLFHIKIKGKLKKKTWVVEKRLTQTPQHCHNRANLALVSFSFLSSLSLLDFIRSPLRGLRFGGGGVWGRWGAGSAIYLHRCRGQRFGLTGAAEERGQRRGANPALPRPWLPNGGAHK